MRVYKQEIKLNHGTITVGFNEYGSVAVSSDLHQDDEDSVDSRFSAGIDVIESIVLAHACSGVKITSKKYVEGLNTALDALVNNL